MKITNYNKFDNDDKKKINKGNFNYKKLKVVDIRRDYGREEDVYYMAGGTGSNLVVV